MSVDSVSAVLPRRIPSWLPDCSTRSKLFLASFVALFAELIIIRYLSTEIRVFAYLKNLPLIASFFGIGLGMILGSPSKTLRSALPAIAFALFGITALANPLHITHIALPGDAYYVWGLVGIYAGLKWLRFIAIVSCVLTLIIAFFVPVGGIVGEQLSGLLPLEGYAINLAGSLLGVAGFTIISFLHLPPFCWAFIAFVCLLPFFSNRSAILFFVLATAVTINLRSDTFWSPYYRIDLRQYPIPQGWSLPSAYYVNVNHDFHLNMLNLSDDFLARYPSLDPYRWAVLNYDLPYKVLPGAKRVLVVGAGSGNDVASALRHNVERVDAVEIDPTIIRLGKLYHPEHPYSSERVTIYNDDARAFFKSTSRKYDLIIFGFLDSQTLLSSFSSVRLDNFVYTRESFREAGRLLNPGGVIVLSFATGKSFVNERMYSTLRDAFGKPPEVYENPSNPDISFVIRNGSAALDFRGLTNVSDFFLQRSRNDLVATDHWPFLYLAQRTIPSSILVTTGLFLLGAVFLLRRTVTLPRFATRESMHLFVLGAGFLLLETRGVTELSLLFGSTWIVNAVVIAAFLCMGLLANIVILYGYFSRTAAYILLIASLLVSLFLPYSVMEGLSGPLKILAAGVVVGLPVFFSGLIFSSSFRAVASPAQALGVNLFGAVVGGCLENMVMIGGTPLLGALALFLYFASWVLVPSIRST